MLNIVIPMAGRGSRFKDAGYDLPKPLIPVLGKPMIQAVIDNLCPSIAHRFIFICLKEHLKDYDLESLLKKWTPNCVVISLDQVTEGAACTVLLAKKYINSSEPLMIANCDQWVGIDINDYLQAGETSRLDGMIMTMEASDPKWSYVKFSEQGEIVGVVEKQVVSKEATVGIYNFSKGSEFVRAAEQMIHKNLRVNGEFYVAPVYNELISEKAKIGIYNIGSVGNGMYGLGIPADLKSFESLKVSV